MPPLNEEELIALLDRIVRTHNAIEKHFVVFDRQLKDLSERVLKNESQVTRFESEVSALARALESRL
jgi:hypothetical protein